MKRTIGYLLSVDEETFVSSAYQCLLGREPDEAGKTYYLRRLREDISRLQILREITESAECISRGTMDVPGLDKALREHGRASNKLSRSARLMARLERATAKLYQYHGQQFAFPSANAGVRAKAQVAANNNLAALGTTPADVPPLQAPATPTVADLAALPPEPNCRLLLDIESRTNQMTLVHQIADVPNAATALSDSDVTVITPLQGIELDALQGLPWVSVDEDPAFAVLNNTILNGRSGWYAVQFCIHTDITEGLAKVYLDLGRGYSEIDCVHALYSNGKPCFRVFHAAAPILNLRFDPKDNRGNFSLKYLRFFKVDASFAENLVIAEISTNHASFKDLPVDAILDAAAEKAKSSGVALPEALSRIYQDIFAFAVRQGPSYRYWIEKFEGRSFPSVETMRKDVRAFSTRPLISVVIPTYNTPKNYLVACIESVKKQVYSHWELCIADDASTLAEVRETLDSYSKQDRRIKVTYRPENGHISAATNTALKMAKGQYVALLDHDDLLAPSALYFVAKEINEYPDAQIIYSDEDKIDENGVRFQPHFKSDWNPDLFFTHNYVSHLGVYKTSLLEKVGGFNIGVEGSQDYDLLLRCIPHLKSHEVRHIPLILYHWRAVSGSTALTSNAKDYAQSAAQKALSEYFASTEDRVEIRAGDGDFRLTWAVPTPAPLVTIIIPTRDQMEVTKRCIDSIFALTSYGQYEILLVDNGSVEDETLAYFSELALHDNVRVVAYDRPFNYSAINNFAVAQARGAILCLLNNDTEIISPDWLTEMVGHACRAEIGCVGAKLYYSDDTIQHAGVICGLGGVAGHSHKHYPRNHSGYFKRLQLVQNLSAVTAACMVVRREIYEEVGGLDEKNLTIAFNDVDFCLRVAKAGYRNLWTPYAELYHHESISRGVEDTPDKMQRFQSEVAYMRETWKEACTLDPFYNPNLTHAREDFTLRMD